ncbi:oligosaccharide flippase family protein [Granulosicoccaceae sp. 1_MG-2023]|nr:oligosaccharide flippase family protein [Granulosicoccaceae sp. 1_MG-2023]
MYQLVPLMLVKGFSAVSAFILTLLIVRLLNPDGAGRVLLVITIVTVLSNIFKFGLDVPVLRFLSVGSKAPARPGLITLAIVWSLLLACPIIAVLYSVSGGLVTSVFGKPELLPTLRMGLLAVPFFSVAFLVSRALLAKGLPVQSSFFEGVGVSAVFILLIFFFAFLEVAPFDDRVLIGLYLGSAIFVLILSLFVCARRCGFSLPNRFVDLEMFRSAWNYWVATLMNMLVQWSGLVVAAIFISSRDVAYLSAAQRVASLVSFILIVINMLVAPKFALYSNEGELYRLKRLAKRSCRLVSSVAFCMLVFILLFSDKIMLIFGPEYVSAVGWLSVLALGQFINAATGSVGVILNMTGHEREFRTLTLYVGPFTVVLSFVLASNWGASGAACATALGLALQNVGAFVLVKRRLGFWAC